MKKTCTMKSNFRRNSLANCLTSYTAGVLFWQCSMSGETTQYVGRQEEGTSASPLARVTASPTPIPLPLVAHVLQCPWAQVTGYRNVPPLLARKFGPHLSLVECRCLEPCSSPPLHPSPCTFFSHWHLSTTPCSLPCLHPLNHFTSHRVGAEITMNLGHLWKQPLAPKLWLVPVSCDVDRVMLKVVKNLLSLLCSELCSTFSPTRTSQFCFTKHLNCCSSKADNEALACYLREAGFIKCAHTLPNTDSIKTTFAILTPAYIRMLKTRLQSLSRHIALPAVSQNLARCPLSVFQKWITPINVQWAPCIGNEEQ